MNERIENTILMRRIGDYVFPIRSYRPNHRFPGGSAASWIQNVSQSLCQLTSILYPSRSKM